MSEGPLWAGCEPKRVLKARTVRERRDRGDGKERGSFSKLKERERARAGLSCSRRDTSASVPPPTPVRLLERAPRGPRAEVGLRALPLCACQRGIPAPLWRSSATAKKDASGRAGERLAERRSLKFERTKRSLQSGLKLRTCPYSRTVHGELAGAENTTSGWM
ncbi:hypothetical protein ATANTOWER_007226 [Ataeniobius toweri]|uniref:Uncharacterized protein n=1 Tax=Ataeniobius toweri TaxID=208326 RepID=A0ABU7CF77_9TELE|nr:hypothetical protein [Ataeniobius toweri]